MRASSAAPLRSPCPARGMSARDGSAACRGGRQRLGHGLRRTDHKRRAAVANAGHVAEFPDRRQLLERARPDAAGLGVDPRAVEIQHLVQPGFAFVPCLVARLGDMQA